MQHNHFYIQKKHVKNTIGNYPINLTYDSFKCFSSNEEKFNIGCCQFLSACEKMKNAEISAASLKESSIQLQKYCANLIIKEFVQKNFNKASIQSKSNNPILHVLQSIPVYLVLKGYDKTTEVDKFKEYPIPPTPDKCIDISVDELEMLFDCETEQPDDKELKESDWQEWQLLGCYQRDDLDLSKDIDIALQSRIFLWIDNIQETAKQYRCSYESLFFQVLCHEFVHALMDVYNKEYMQPDLFDSRKKTIYQAYREESLANGISLYLLKHSKYANDYPNIESFVRSQFDQYTLGIALQYPFAFIPSIKDWMEQKMGKKPISRDDLYAWMKQACDTLRIL